MNPYRKIEELKRELHEAREVLINIQSNEIRMILYSYGRVKTIDDLWHWRREAIVKIIAQTEIIPDAGEDYNGQRAYCPLCGGEAAQWGYDRTKGFAYPEGLRRHLDGEGTARQCQVFREIIEMAREKLQED